MFLNYDAVCYGILNNSYEKLENIRTIWFCMDMSFNYNENLLLKVSKSHITYYSFSSLIILTYYSHSAKILIPILKRIQNKITRDKYTGIPLFNLSRNTYFAIVKNHNSQSFYNDHTETSRGVKAYKRKSVYVNT